MERIDPELLPHLLSLNDDEVILPLRLKREDVKNVKAVKVSDEELQKINSLQNYLYGRGFIPENSFASLFVYLFNLGFTMHKLAAEEEAKQEAKV